MKKYLFVILTLLTAFSAQASELYKVDSSNSSVNWKANRFGFSDQSGKITNISGYLDFDEVDPKSASVEVEIGVESLVTGFAKLDEHLKSSDFLNVAKFPTAKFKSTAIIPFGKTFAKIKGDLTLLGVTKSVTLDAKLIKKGTNPVNQQKTIAFYATTSLKRSDFGMNFGLPGIGNLVSIEINLEATYVSGESGRLPGAGPILSQTNKGIAANIVPEWKIIAEKSAIEFSGIRDKSAIKGSFKKFSGQITFDKNQLSKSKVQIDIDTSSIELSYDEATQTILGSDWLAANLFPKASFISDRIILLSDINLSKMADLNMTYVNDMSQIQTNKNSDVNLKNLKKPNSYRAEGSLIIKGKKVPTSIDFVLTNYSPTQASATGKMAIKRSTFGIGNLRSKMASGVDDNIEINFTISGER